MMNRGDLQGGTHTDIVTDGWIGTLPRWVQPYALLARWDRPVGIWLLLFPCWWGLALAHSKTIDWYLLFGLGAVAMRGAGCVLNDIIDRKLDAKVERTRHRPLPAGLVSVGQAIVFLLLQLGIAAGVAFALGREAVILSVAILIVVAIYPLMKRVTWWPQLFLGIAFNWGVLVAWAVAREEPDLPALLLYLAGICWTLGYDTIYALQDREDDERVGIRSTALLWGDDAPRWIALFYTGFIVLLIAAGFTFMHGWALVIAAGVATLHLLWQVATLDPTQPKNCLMRFRSNTVIGWIVLVGLLAEW